MLDSIASLIHVSIDCLLINPTPTDITFTVSNGETVRATKKGLH